MKKGRHIVSWSQEEDDILREQISLHGSENWAIIASKFKDKTTRQCRRRWFTYLNSDFKKGGWSPEEDILLCEAQRIYGNRWTEIAKVVSGRTDNAVKNRFTTLCKKRTKHEALAKVNSSTSYINLNNKRVLFRNELNSDEGGETAAPLKNIRASISSTTEIPKHGEKSATECAAAVADQSMENTCIRRFLNKGDPKVLALMQQAQLLSSLAIKVNTDATNQSLESACMVLEDFLKQNGESRLLKATNKETEFRLEKLKGLEEDIGSCDEGRRSSWREIVVYESSEASSEYSTRSTMVSNVPSDALHMEILEAEKLDQHSEEKEVCHMTSTNEVKTLPTHEDVKPGNAEFSSPTHVTLLFRTLAAAIPSPKFSESEKHFLMKTLGLESTSPSQTMNPSQPPSCKRSLLHCL